MLWGDGAGPKCFQIFALANFPLNIRAKHSGYGKQKVNLHTRDVVKQAGKQTNG